MTVIAFNDEVSKDQLKQYADVICFSQVGMNDEEISEYLKLPQYLVTAWIGNWVEMETQAMGLLQ